MQQYIKKLIGHFILNVTNVLIVQVVFYVTTDLIGATTEDIAVLKNNFRKSEAKSPIMSKTKEIIERWNWADKLIYEHFKNKTEALLEEKKEYIHAGQSQHQVQVSRSG